MQLSGAKARGWFGVVAVRLKRLRKNSEWNGENVNNPSLSG